MNITYRDGTGRSTMDPKFSELAAAFMDPNVSSVALHNAPLPGAVIEGRIVDEDNRANLILRHDARWTWKP